MVNLSSFRAFVIVANFVPLEAFPITWPHIKGEISKPLGRFLEIEYKGVYKGSILINIYKGVRGGKRVVSLKYAFRLILVTGDYSKTKTYIKYYKV